jgi:hypothetical protein
VTFAIFGVGGDGKASERKGALQVVDVLGPHVSKAKVTEVNDPYRAPVLNGDVLINPAWSATDRQHVAIAGLIDLTGEGNNEIEEFMRTLRKQGVVIDAYLDLRDMSVKGGKITAKTNYLILGESPDVQGNTSGKLLDDPRVARKQDILGKIGDMRKEANDLGVTIVPLQRFVALTGYRLPKGARKVEGKGVGYDNPDVFKEPKDSGKKSDRPAAKDKDKEMKKDDDDK